MIKKGELVEILIEKLVFEGAGMGRVALEEGEMVVFVDGVVPGDRVSVRINHLRKRYARGYVVKFLEYSTQRVKARCRHFGLALNNDGEVIPFEPSVNCGGCSWQFMSYSDQIATKVEIVQDSLKRLGGVFDLMVMRPAVVMDRPWHYRNKMEFSFSRDAKGELTLGLHLKGRHHDLSEIEECHIFRPWIGEFLGKMREFFDEVNFEGELKSLVVRVGTNTDEVLVNLLVENGQVDFGNALVEAVKSGVSGKLVSIFVTEIANRKGFPKRRIYRRMWGDDYFVESLRLKGGELKFQVGPEDFLQPNTLQAEQLYNLVGELAELQGHERVYDLYCGTGTIGLSLAGRAAQVIGIELNENAIVNAKKNAELNGITNAQFVAANVTEALPQIRDQMDLIVVDPPRAGLNEKVIEAIGKTDCRRVIYVSCNPTTMARDLVQFRELGFNLGSVTPVDQFCHTYHIETVSLLER